jgi:hypothetical protein
MERRMKPYTFYLHDWRRESPSFRFVTCENDDHARTHAHGLLEALPELTEVEIYDGRASRFRVGRPRNAACEQRACG